jgi:hypothetical protein
MCEFVGYQNFTQAYLVRGSGKFNKEQTKAHGVNKRAMEDS